MSENSKHSVRIKAAAVVSSLAASFNGMALVYDHPNYPASIQLETQ